MLPTTDSQAELPGAGGRYPPPPILFSVDRDTCYFDGQCGMCRRSVTWLRRLDWLGRLRFADMTTAADLPVAFDVAMRGMPMQTRSGRVHVGFPAVRRALLQTPLGFLPACLLYIPGISHVGTRYYGYIARRRRRNAVCRLPTRAPSPPDAD